MNVRQKIIDGLGGFLGIEFNGDVAVIGAEYNCHGSPLKN
jgi:hypothetical protein